MLIPLLLLAQQAVAITNVTVIPMDRERVLARGAKLNAGENLPETLLNGLRRRRGRREQRDEAAAIDAHPKLDGRGRVLAVAAVRDQRSNALHASAYHPLG